MGQRLTDTAVKKAQGKDKPYMLPDGGGLGLYVTPTSKLWHGGTALKECRS